MMSLVSHVCIHPWSAQGIEGGLSLQVGERIFLQRKEGEWGIANRVKEANKVRYYEEYDK